MLKKIILSIVATMALCVSAQASERTLVVAHDATWAPMEFSLDNKLVGYSVDYIDAVAKEAGFTVEHKAVAWDGIFSGLNSARYDVVASSVTITPEREAKYDFSTPYCDVHQSVVVAIDSPIKSKEDMKGKTFGAQVSTTGHLLLKKMEGVSVKPYDDIGLAMADLKNKRTDGVVCDSPVAAYYANKRQDFAEKLRIAFGIEEVEHYGFVVKKGNKEVLDLINKGIEAVKANGIEEELKKKWFGV